MLVSFFSNSKVKSIRSLLNFTIFLFLIFLGANCTKEAPVKSIIEKHGAAFYFLADTTLKVSDVTGKDLGSLELQDFPWICNSDIALYDWSCHNMFLIDNCDQYFPVYGEIGRLPPYMNNRPFIVMADDLPCYIGNIACMGVGSWENPIIYEIDLMISQPDLITLQYIWFGQDDPCDNPDFKDVLIRDGLFAAGVAVDFDTLTPFLIYPGDTTRITYTYTLTNLESAPLYLFDQLKAGDDAFEYFSIGPVLYCVENSHFYYAIDSNDSVPEKCEWSIEDWYTKVAPGETITRTWMAEYDLRLPDGEYHLTWPYITPQSRGYVTSREVEAGRLWMGIVKTAVYAIDLTPPPNAASGEGWNRSVTFLKYDAGTLFNLKPMMKWKPH
ncbi:hypothetical protein KAR48_18465 [bacterium]|nr:hypothetical protein [bacterium]